MSRSLMGFSKLDNLSLPTIRGCSSISNKKADASGASNLLFFCDDVLVEILCRLPQKYVVRFKCVSKSWCHLINTIYIPRVSLYPTACSRDIHIAGLYFRTYKPPEKHRYQVHRVISEGLWGSIDATRVSGLYLGVKHNENYWRSRGSPIEWEECFTNYGLPFMPKQDDFLDCCNGLLLFVYSPSSQYYVCNPETRQCIPIPTACLHKEHTMYAALAFDPSKSPNYRVVQFEHFQTEDVGLDIYSSDTGVWVKYLVKLHPYVVGSMLTRYSVYFEGALYRFSSCLHLVRFDLEEVQASMIDLPIRPYNYEGRQGCFGVLMGELCYSNVEGSSILIWSLEDSRYSNWIFKYSIPIPGFSWMLRNRASCLCPRKPSWLQLCAFHPSRDAIFISTTRLIAMFDCETDKLYVLAKIDADRVILPGFFSPAAACARFLVPFNELGKFY